MEPGCQKFKTVLIEQGGRLKLIEDLRGMQIPKFGRIITLEFQYNVHVIHNN